MLCSVCKEAEATVHLTQIVADKMQKVDLCEACSKQKGVNDPTGYSLAGLLLGLGGAPDVPETADGNELKCGVCGFSQADLKKSGRLGCPECYQVFSDGLQGMLKSMHKATKHVGKAPAALKASRDFKEKSKTLQKKLDRAIAEENYEAAARLRDELKHLKETSDAPAVS